jgi:hypothetical protein
LERAPKHIRRLVREYAAIAYDRELGEALRRLDAEFDRWERKDLSSFELNDAIHTFHQGPARDIWAKYSTNHLEPALGFALATGILRKDEIPEELLEHLAGWIEFYESDASDS